MSAVDDYLCCPALTKWLPARLEGCTVHYVATGRAGPRSLVRFARRWPEASGAEGEEGEAAEADADAIVVVGSLRRPAPIDVLQRVAPGTLVVELAAIGGLRIGERLFGIAARRSTRRLTARRLEAWLTAGLAEVEQWIATDPPDTCVTIGRRR